MIYTEMMVPIRRVALFLLILWLPVQGIAAVAMPFCAHALGHENAAADVQTGHEHHGHAHGPASDMHPGQDSEPANHPDLGCNGCGPCHLACAPAVPAAATLVLMSAEGDYSPLCTTLARLFIPEQPQPPPNPSI